MSAIKQGYIRFDPLQGVELPAPIAKEVVPPTVEQVWKLIDTAAEIKRRTRDDLSCSPHRASAWSALGALL